MAENPTDLAEKFLLEGNSFVKDENFRQAIDAYDKAIQIDPEYALAFYNKGFSLEKLGKGEEAIKFYKDAIKINPELETMINQAIDRINNLK